MRVCTYMYLLKKMNVAYIKEINAIDFELPSFELFTIDLMIRFYELSHTSYS